MTRIAIVSHRNDREWTRGRLLAGSRLAFTHSEFRASGGHCGRNVAFLDFISQSALPQCNADQFSPVTRSIVHNRRASSVTSGFHTLLGTSCNPDRAVNLGAVSAVYQDQSSSLGFFMNATTELSEWPKITGPNPLILNSSVSA